MGLKNKEANLTKVADPAGRDWKLPRFSSPRFRSDFPLNELQYDVIIWNPRALPSGLNAVCEFQTIPLTLNKTSLEHSFYIYEMRALGVCVFEHKLCSCFGFDLLMILGNPWVVLVYQTQF